MNYRPTACLIACLAVFLMAAPALAQDLTLEQIMADPDWQGGNYLRTGRRPTRGLSVARGEQTEVCPDSEGASGPGQFR